jgi:DNA-binding response OmpR family regulator
MLYSGGKMPVVFVIARDWALRTGVRAELRERGIKALGMESAAEAGAAIAAGEMPAVVVIEATSEIAGDPAIQELIKRVLAILVASRTEKVPLPPADTVFYRPVRIGEIVARVEELVRRGHAA